MGDQDDCKHDSLTFYLLGRLYRLLESFSGKPALDPIVKYKLKACMY